MADELDVHFGRINGAKIGGSSAAIIGGILATVGFGLSFVTFGASLGLSIAGGVVGGVGGATAGGARIADCVLSSKTKKKSEKLCKELQETGESLRKECLEIGKLLGDPADIDNRYPSWVKVWGKLVAGSGAVVQGVGWNAITGTVLRAITLAASYSDDATRIGVQAGSTAFRSLGTAARGFHIFGGVAGILFIPFDIYTLVDSSVNVHKGNEHEVSRILRDIAKKFEENCPTEGDIDGMIRETIANIDL